MTFKRHFLALIAALPLLGGAAFAADGDGAKIYKRCSACHLQTGEGVPGAFPPLDAHVSSFAETREGRDYLIMVLSAGLTGEIKVGDKSYRGFMPAQPMKDEDAADVMNHVLKDIIKPASPAEAFTAAEVADIRARHKGTKAADVLKLRPAADGKGVTTSK